MDIRIRSEKQSDAGAIQAVTRAAFTSVVHSDHTEHLIVEALRDAGALAVSVVAEISGKVVGDAAASPVAISDSARGWFGLGPVSVAPDYQGRGIGSRLVREVLRLLGERQAAGRVVLGETAYYGRFGFHRQEDLVLPGVPPGYLQVVQLGSRTPSGKVSYHHAFTAPRH